MNKRKQLIDESGNIYHVLINKRINKKSPKIINVIDGIDSLYGRYYYNGKLVDREEGPAIEWTDGTKEWYKNGELHRENGPAVEYIDGKKEYWIEGANKKESEYNIYMRNKISQEIKEELTEELIKKEVKKKIKI